MFGTAFDAPVTCCYDVVLIILPRFLKLVAVIFGNLVVKIKLLPRKGFSLEIIEPHPKKRPFSKRFFYMYVYIYIYIYIYKCKYQRNKYNSQISFFPG